LVVERRVIPRYTPIAKIASVVQANHTGHEIARATAARTKVAATSSRPSKSDPQAAMSETPIRIAVNKKNVVDALIMSSVLTVNSH